MKKEGLNLFLLIFTLVFLFSFVSSNLGYDLSNDNIGYDLTDDPIVSTTKETIIIENGSIFCLLAGCDMVGDINMTNNSIIEIFSLLFSNGDSITGNDSIVVNINGTNRALFGQDDTIFTGNVQNIDDINNFSRFSETNINDGLSAVAGFTANNDNGESVVIGLTSSRFRVLGTPTNNTAFIFSTSNRNFNFAVGTENGFNWLNNLGPMSFENTNNILMNLSGEGELNVGENITSKDFTVNGYMSFEHQTTPILRSGYVQLYSKSNNNLYIMESTGTERRIVDAGGGSIILDEVIIFSNETQFTGINNSFVGGSAYVCIYNNGSLFSSEVGCP